MPYIGQYNYKKMHLDKTYNIMKKKIPSFNIWIIKEEKSNYYNVKNVMCMIVLYLVLTIKNYLTIETSQHSHVWFSRQHSEDLLENRSPAAKRRQKGGTTLS